MGHSQALDHAERAQSEIVAEDGEEAVEEGCGPADFRHDQDDDLEDDEEAVKHSPESSSGLVRDSAASDSETRISKGEGPG